MIFVKITRATHIYWVQLSTTWLVVFGNL